MTETLHTLERIAIPFPEERVFLRLGGRLNRTDLPEDAAREFRRVALLAFERCRLRGRWCVIAARAEADGIRLADGTLIPGADFAGRCAGIRAVWCAAATAGGEIVAFRDARKQVAESAVCDAVGGECADAALEFLHRQAAVQLRSAGLLVRKNRYSPGYGDMPLAVQKFFFARLALEELGLSLSDNFFITPEKSVTAFAGVD